MLRRISMIAGAILLVGGTLWQLSSVGRAQTIAPGSDSDATRTGIVGFGQAGPIAEIDPTGSSRYRSAGTDMDAVPIPGRSATGSSVTPTGPGTGSGAIQRAPGAGQRIFFGQAPPAAGQ